MGDKVKVVVTLQFECVYEVEIGSEAYEGESNLFDCMLIDRKEFFKDHETFMQAVDPTPIKFLWGVK